MSNDNIQTCQMANLINNMFTNPPTPLGVSRRVVSFVSCWKARASLRKVGWGAHLPSARRQPRPNQLSGKAPIGPTNCQVKRQLAQPTVRCSANWPNQLSGGAPIGPPCCRSKATLAQPAGSESPNQPSTPARIH